MCVPHFEDRLIELAYERAVSHCTRDRTAPPWSGALLGFVRKCQWKDRHPIGLGDQSALWHFLYIDIMALAAERSVMAQAYSIGRVTSDLELKVSVKKVPYLRFTIAERVGYRDSAHMQYIQVWAWDDMAQKLVDTGVKKGSLLRVSGSLELEEYTRQDGVTRDKRLKLRLKDWAFASAAKRHEGTPRPKKEVPAPEIINGDLEPLPE